MPAPPLCNVPQKPQFYNQPCLCVYCKNKDRCPRKSNLQACYACLENITDCPEFEDYIREEYNKGFGIKI